MPNTTITILRRLRESGELTIQELAKLLPLQHGDHRDFYLLASLVARGLIDDPYFPAKDQNGTRVKEQLLARKFYATAFADKSATYQGHTWSIHGSGETLKDQKYALSGLGQIYLEEFETKRADRLWSIATSTVAGIAVALATFYLGVK